MELGLERVNDVRTTLSNKPEHAYEHRHSCGQAVRPVLGRGQFALYDPVRSLPPLQRAHPLEAVDPAGLLALSAVRSRSARSSSRVVKRRDHRGRPVLRSDIDGADVRLLPVAILSNKLKTRMVSFTGTRQRVIEASQLAPTETAVHKLSAGEALAAVAVAIVIGFYVKSVLDRRWRT